MEKKWVLDPDIESGKKPSRHHHRYYDQDEYIVVETPFVVPNDKWAMMRPLGSAWSKLVGADHTEVEDIMLDNLYGVYNALYISDKPFGYITAEDLEYIPGELQAQPVGNRYLHVAQKIHKGELLPGLSIPSIEIVRQAPDLSRKHGDCPNTPDCNGQPRGRDQKRNHIRWARLTDVIAVSGFNARDALIGFWPFIGWSMDYTTGRHGTMLHIVEGSAESIKSETPSVRFLDLDESWQMASGSIRSLQNIWIRAGLAKTILHLQALGVQPEVTQSA